MVFSCATETRGGLPRKVRTRRCLTAWLANGPHIMQGVGKSALATALTNRMVVRKHWPAGRTADLRHVKTLDEAAHAVCCALGVPHFPVPLTALQVRLLAVCRVAIHSAMW